MPQAGQEKAKAGIAQMEAELESPLVARLRKQTQDNAEKNARQVDINSFQNSQSGEFGPFSRWVPVSLQDGRTYVLVQAGEYEALKKAKKAPGGASRGLPRRASSPLRL